MFYQTFGPDGEYVGRRAVTGGRADNVANALAEVGLGVAAVELRNPAAATGAVVGVILGSIWLSQRPRGYVESGELDFTGPSQRTSDLPLPWPDSDSGYGAGEQPAPIGPMINVPLPPQPQTVVYVALTDEERNRITDSLITPIPDTVGGWILIYPAADPAVIADLVMMRNLSDNLGSRLGDGYQAHHIIPWSDARATQLRIIVLGAGITDINIAENGIWLPANDRTFNLDGSTPHNQTFRDSYFEYLENALDGASTSDIFQRLNKIKDDLARGKNFPLKGQ